MYPLKSPLVVMFVLLAGSAPLLAQSAAPAPRSPSFEQYLFPPDLIVRHQEEIGLEPQQRDAIREEVKVAQSTFLDLHWDIEAESARMAKLLHQSPVDEQAVLAQADTLMELESRVKRCHLSLLVRVRNLLTEDQIVKLTELRATLVAPAPPPLPALLPAPAPVPEPAPVVAPEPVPAR